MIFLMKISFILQVEVDSQTKELVIAVSGIRPSVEVTDSSGAKMPTKDITRLSEIVVSLVFSLL